MKTRQDSVNWSLFGLRKRKSYSNIKPLNVFSSRWGNNKMSLIYLTLLLFKSYYSIMFTFVKH